MTGMSAEQLDLREAVGIFWRDVKYALRSLAGAKISELVSQEFLCDCFHREGPTIYNICTVLAC